MGFIINLKTLFGNHTSNKELRKSLLTADNDTVIEMPALQANGCDTEETVDAGAADDLYPIDLVSSAFHADAGDELACIVWSYCVGDCRDCRSLDAVNDYFVKAGVHARKSGDYVEAKVILTTKHNGKYVLSVSRDSVEFESVLNDVSIVPGGFVEVNITKTQNENLVLDPLDVDSFIDEQTNETNDSVDLVFSFVSDLMKCRRWDTSDGFKWFLWTMVYAKQRSKQQ